MDRSLYLTYRPQTFAEVVEQEHVCRTLANAIETGRLAHAYLFCGPRGTGKTSTARILARALNCEKGPSPTPCGECDNCRRIRDGYTMDVVELDAASNRGIDEIRDLRRSVQYAPSEGRYKFYIIDEAHQITKDAFNALLKTLEEPPDYVIFVLATTEPDRLPDTILSRCQRFDFKRVSNEALVAHLTKIAKLEGVDIEEAAVRAIVRGADGAVRDGLTVLEQMLSFSEGKITHQDVIAALGLTETELLCKLSGAVIQGDAPALLEAVADAMDAGKDIHQLLKDLARHFRDLLILSLGAESAELKALAPDLQSLLREQAQKLERSRAVHIIDVLSQAQGELRWNPHHRLVLELALLKAAEESPTAAPHSAAPPPRPASARPPAPPPRPPGSPRSPESPRPARPAPAPRPAPPRAAATPPAGNVAVISDRWPEALAAVKQQSVPVHALLVDSVPLAMQDGVIVLGFHHQFHRDHCAEPANKQLVETAIASVFGPVRIDCQLAAEWRPPAPQEREPAADADAAAPPPSAPETPDPDAFMREAVTLFDGAILDQSSS